MLRTVASDEEWYAACQAIKKARGGRYSPDWYDKVLKPRGFLNQFQARIGEPVSCGIQVLYEIYKEDIVVIPPSEWEE